jgi:branched-chain amino acid transport system ATP-binding protein
VNATRPTPLLELRAVRAGYDGVEVLHGIDLTVDAGTVLAVLGPNGAGKTTMLRVISAMVAPTSGEVLVGGRVLNGVEPGALARAGVCTVPEGRAVFPNLTVRENLWLTTCTMPGAAAPAGRSGRREAEEVAFSYFPRLAVRRRELAGNLSGGEQQMLAMARAIATRPGLLLLDELSMGLAPLIVDQLFTTVGRLAAEGIAIIIVEQFATAVLDLADRAVLVDNGRIRAAGSPDTIRHRLRDAYLGEEVQL